MSGLFGIANAAGAAVALSGPLLVCLCLLFAGLILVQAALLAGRWRRDRSPYREVSRTFCLRDELDALRAQVLDPPWSFDLPDDVPREFSGRPRHLRRLISDLLQQAASEEQWVLRVMPRQRTATLLWLEFSLAPAASSPTDSVPFLSATRPFGLLPAVPVINNQKEPKEQLMRESSRVFPMTGPGMAAAESSPVDQEVALARVGGDLQLLREIAHLFCESHEEMMQSIRQAVNERDAAALELSAHSFKGSVSNFGAKQATEAALELEIIGRQEQWDGVEQALARLENALVPLRPALRYLAAQ